MRKTILKNIFSKLEQHEIEFIVLRNHDEIPEKISIDNDLDLVVKPIYNNQLKKLLIKNNFKIKNNFIDPNTYLYKSKPHIHFFDYRNNLHLDIVNNLSYRSPNNNEWVSVHEEIQNSLWNNKIKTNSLWIYEPSIVDLLIHLICHCIFDKKSFNYKYCEKIKYLYQKCEKQKLKDNLKLIFFKFTEKLISMIGNDELDKIINNYYSFSNY